MGLCFGIVAAAEDSAALTFTELAHARGHEVVGLPLTRLARGVAVAFDGASSFLGGRELEALDGFFVRQVPALVSPAPSEAGVAPAQQSALHAARADRALLSQSLLLHVEALGRPMVNRFGPSLSFDSKPFQLSALQRAGVPIPDTVVTNSVAVAREFARSVEGELIVKPVSGGALTRLFGDETVRALEATGGAQPVILQRRIRGSDLRITVVGDRIVSAVEIQAEADAVDYRGVEAYLRGEERYRPIEVDRELERIVLRCASVCEQTLSGVDVKKETGGGYVVLEANGAPVYSAIEAATGDPITAAVLDWLEARSHGS